MYKYKHSLYGYSIYIIQSRVFVLVALRMNKIYIADIHLFKFIEFNLYLYPIHRSIRVHGNEDIRNTHSNSIHSFNLF